MKILSKYGCKLLDKIAVIITGVFCFLFGLLCLGIPILGLLILHNDLKISLEDMMAILGLLGIFLSGFYFIWNSYTIIIHKRISFSVTLIFATVPSFLIAFCVSNTIIHMWDKPSEGYGIIFQIAIMVLHIILFVIPWFIIMKALVNLFRRVAINKQCESYEQDRNMEKQDT